MKYFLSIIAALFVGALSFSIFVSITGAMWNMTFTESISVLPITVMGCIISVACTIKTYIESFDLHRTDDHIELEYVDNDHIFLN